MDGTGMQQEPVGVTVTENRCRRNDPIAYDIAESALLTINTNTLFPNGIPRDFSILVVAKPKVGQYSLQSIYPNWTVFSSLDYNFVDKVISRMIQ